MGRFRRVAVLLPALTILLLGCSRQAAQPNSKLTESSKVILPSWAPKNPSPEFLRAAKVLKPLPDEMLRGRGMNKLLVEALIKVNHRSWPYLYELFGSMTDNQIKAFLAKKELRIPAKSLTAKQRSLLDKYLDEVTRGMGSIQGGPPELKQMSDYRVMLYKEGAKEDFSNVKVGFIAQLGHLVHIQFWIRKPDGSEDGPCSGFAQI